MTEVIMPKMGDGMEEGTLVEWLKKDGEKVKTGEVIGTIQTDKATLELEAPDSGVLSGFLLQEGGTVPVGVPIAAILKDGESLPEGWNGKDVKQGTVESLQKVDAPSGTGAPASAPIEMQQEATTPLIPESASSEFGVTADQPVKTSGKGTEQTALEAKTPELQPNQLGTGRLKASPLARRIADELGVDIQTVAGSGPGGRVVEKDVRAAAEAGVKLQPAPAGAAPAQVKASAEDQTVDLNRLRQITAKRTTESKQQVPHFYVTVEVDVEKILSLRRMFEEEESGKVSINDFVVKACALALREMPAVNSAFQGKTLLQFGGVHVGIAVALDGGLTVPVIKNADQLSLRSISTSAKELAKKARENKLSLDELSGTTFSISNMGMLDVDNFIAIINQPAAAILAIASVRKKVVATEDDEVEIRSRMNITCSFDHRVVDGAVGAKFVNVVKDYLENPTRLLT